MAQKLPLRELLHRIQDALETMDPLPFAVFERHRHRHLDYPRIAAELGISVDDVERNLAAAMVHIDRSVSEDGEP